MLGIKVPMSSKCWVSFDWDVQESRQGIEVQMGSGVILSVCNQGHFVKWMNIIYFMY